MLTMYHLMKISDIYIKQAMLAQQDNSLFTNIIINN